MFLQVQKVLKSTPNAYEAMSKFLKENVFETAAREYMKKNGNVLPGIWGTMEPTEIMVMTAPSGNTYNIKKDIKKLLPKKEEGGLFDRRDERIIDLFEDENFTDIEAVSGKVQAIKEYADYRDFGHREVTEDGENLGIYQEYELGHALLLANELVKVGAMKSFSCIIIYLKRKKGDRYRLLVHKDTLNCFSINLDETWRDNRIFIPGYGVLFSGGYF